MTRIIDIPTFANIPAYVPFGVLYYTQDTKQMYIGTGASSGAAVTLVAGGATVLSVSSYGAAGDGVTDDTAAINSAILAAYNAGGGTVFFPVSNYLVLGHIVLPNDGSISGPNPYSRQKPIRLTGVSAEHGGQGQNPSGGSVLLAQYNGSGVAKIETYGLGLLEIDHLSFYDSTGGTLPFLFTTGTTLHVHDNSFTGSQSGVGCNQDVILLGGYNGTFASVNDPTAAFQGYNSYFRRNYFSGVRRAFYLKTYAGANDISNNFVGPRCGSNLVAATRTLTAAATASGGTTVYTGTITGGDANGLVTQVFGVTGFVTSANNGTFVCVASTATTLTLRNASGVSGNPCRNGRLYGWGCDGVRRHCSSGARRQ